MNYKRFLVYVAAPIKPIEGETIESNLERDVRLELEEWVKVGSVYERSDKGPPSTLGYGSPSTFGGGIK